MTNCCIFRRPPSSSAARNFQSSSSPLRGTSTENTPRSSTQSSPIFNLTREYTFAVQTNSYSEIWSKIHPNNCSYQEVDPEHLDGLENQQLLAHLLQPNTECVKDALLYAKPSTLTRLVSAYFDHSEHTTQLCVLLLESVHQARSLYAPLYDLLDVLPSESDSLTQFQCDRAFDIFLEFDCLENPFPCPESHNFDDMRCCFSELKQQLDFYYYKSHSRVRFLRRACAGSAICLIGTTVSVAASAVAIASHALAALLVIPFLPALLPSKIAKKELAHLAQLDTAARGTYVLQKDLDTIEHLVVCLHAAVESDKFLIRLGLERGRDKHPIQEVVKQLHKNHHKFVDQLRNLEEHLCLCFAAINRARSLLLQEIRLHQT